MSENCTHDCSTCSSNCKDRKPVKERTNELSNVKHTIAVVSGKGGVGKSSVTSLLAREACERGYSAAILDADITGPSIPGIFGLSENAKGDEQGHILPVVTESGIRVMSVNLLLENKTDPVVWRGPVISGTVKQFWTDVAWGDVDYMFVDMPPGTGDVPLTVFQSIPIDGIVIVSTPQELVSMIVSKAVRMAELMNVPVIGLIENMAWLECPDCGKKIYPFGESHFSSIADRFSVRLLASLKIDPHIAEVCDEGLMDNYYDGSVKQAFDEIEKAAEKKN